jgi:GNAT superfamily N-acetyltransferase
MGRVDTSMSLTYQHDSPYTLLREGQAMFLKHYAEEASQPDFPMELDEDFYLKGTALGLYRVYTVRDNDTLVGYSAFMLTHNMQAKSCRQANVEALYLDEAYRGGSAGVKLINYSKAELKKEGIHVMRIHCTPGGALDAILTRMNFAFTNKEFELRLDKE